VEHALNTFVQDVQITYGDDLVAVFLYGSATTGEHIAGRSDINVGVVLSRVTPALLRKASGHLRAWVRQGFATPVFFDPEFLRRAVDVFPIEFLDMRTHHRALWGPDLLRDLRIEAEPLRRQCEQELRGKLLKLRQAYVESSGSPKALEAVLVSAVGGLVVLAKTLLHLAHAEQDGGTGAVLDRVETQFGVRMGHLRKAWQLKRGEIRVTGSELDTLYQAVLDEFQRLVQVVDALPA
jgi:predicted nucleotidyltransferase